MTRRWRFWLITCAAALGVLLTMSLGYWQLSRAAQKVSLQEAIDKQAHQSALDNHSFLALTDPSAAIHRPVNLRGTWVSDKTVYLDNRQMNAKPGFYVVTPLLLEGSQSSVLIQRGWVGRNFNDRTSLPSIPSPVGMVEVAGRIAPPPAKLYELGGPEIGPIRQNLDLAQFRAETGLVLLPVSIVQTGTATDGLLRDWPVVGVSASKNYGYAFQWFGLSALIFFLYLWFQIGKRYVSK